MTTQMTQAEQLLLELINRARLDPEAEAVRQGITLNQYIDPAQSGGKGYPITPDPKQPLAGNNTLAVVARNHSAWMDATDSIVHDENAGNAQLGSPTQRIAAAGYVQNGLSWWRDENIAVRNSTAAIDLQSWAEAMHRDWFRDVPVSQGGNMFGEPGGHRMAMLDDNMKEAGIGLVTGSVGGFNSLLGTEEFGVTGTQSFLTGVVYDDTVKNDDFYTINEARQGVTVTVTGNGSDTTGVGGGFSVGIGAGGAKTVTFSGGGLATAVSATVETGTKNAKVDLVNGNEIWSSVTATLGAGGKELHLLGMANIDGTGNSDANVIVGNKGANVLDGRGGNDTVDGAAGDDTVVLTGTRAQYQVTVLSGTSARLTDTRGIDGTDTVVNVERFRFADRTFNFNELQNDVVNAAPVATIADKSLQAGQSAAVSGWLTASDANGDAITQYQFRDDGAAATTGFFSSSANARHAAGADFTIAAADLGSVRVNAGQAAGSETMLVRAFDGKDWGAWDSFALTTTVAANNTPVVSAADFSGRAGTTFAASTLFTASDPDGHAITKYGFWDGNSGASTGAFSVGGVAQAAGQLIEVAANQLNQVSYRGGSVGEALYVRAFDGQEWGNWDRFDFTPTGNVAPVVTTSDQSLKTNQWDKVNDWFSVTDADNNAITKYAFWDGGTGAATGYFWTPDNAHHAAATEIVVDAAQLGNVWFSGGQTAGTEQVWVRAFDGGDWSAWKSLSMTTTSNNTAPGVWAEDQSARANTWNQFSDWFGAWDDDGDTITHFNLWDGGTASTSGYFWTPQNAHHAAQTTITVAASAIEDVWFRSGQSAGSEALWVQAFDGKSWSEWQSFDFTTLGNTAPQVTAYDQWIGQNEWQRVNDWFGVDDADGDAVTQYRFWDGVGDQESGYFWTPENSHHAAGTVITVDAANLDSVWFHGAQTEFVETAWVQAFDGSEWSQWKPMDVSTYML